MPNQNPCMAFDKKEKTLEKSFNEMVAAEVKKRNSIPLFAATASLEERSMHMFNLSFSALPDETKALFIHDLLKNQPAAQYNMLKKQYQLDSQNLILITNAIQKKMQNQNPNLNTCKESATLEIIRNVLLSIIGLKNTTTARPGV